MDQIISILHIVTAVFIVGPMAILPMTAMRGMRAGDSTGVATLAKSTFVFSMLSLLVAVFGFGAVSMADPQWGLTFGTTWVMISIVLYALALLLSLALVVPGLRTAAARLASGEAVGGAYARVAAGSGIVALLLVAVTVLMVWKP